MGLDDSLCRRIQQIYDDCKYLSQNSIIRKQQLDTSMEESRNRSIRRRRRLPPTPAKDVGTSVDKNEVKRHTSRQANRALATTVAGAAAVLFCKYIVLSAATSNIAMTIEENGAAGSLWELVSEDPSYSSLAACLKMADPTIVAALSSSGEHPVTLFAPKDEAFGQQDWSRTLLSRESDGLLEGDSIFDNRCNDEAAATNLMSYHVSTTTSPTAYIGEKFATLLGGDAAVRFYGISKTADVPASFFPIQLVDAANVTAAPTVVGGDAGPSYLYEVDRVLRPPIGTIWETLSADPSFSLLTAALEDTELAQILDNAEGTGVFTLFAPDDDAVRASGGLPDDPEELRVVISYHMLSRGTYPLSLDGAHFAQQLFKVDPLGPTLSRDYYRQFYAEEFEDAQVTSDVGPLLNITRTASTTASVSLRNPPARGVGSIDGARGLVGVREGYVPHDTGSGESFGGETRWELLVEGVPVSEKDITSTNGVVHRLSKAVMDPPPTVAAVLQDPPFPLSAAGGGEGATFDALVELVRIAWPLVNETLTEAGPLTVLAPTDAAFDLAISAGKLPPRPWGPSSFRSSASSSSSPTASGGSSALSPDQAARLIFSHTLQTPDGPFLFSPSVTDPFSSSYTDGERISTAVRVSGGTGVEVGVRVIELSTRSTTALALEVVDKEVFVNEARVFQCVDGGGVGHDCGESPRPSNTYALNGAHLCAVHAVDRVLFPADPETDLASLLQSEPSLSRFYELLEEEKLLPGATGEGGDESGTVPWRRNASSGEKDALGGVGDGGLFTVFAPTNDALERLERNRAWLFGNTPRGGAGDGGHEGRERTENGGQASSPLREMLAYHIAPGSAQYSRYFNSSAQRVSTLALEGTAPVSLTFLSSSDDTSELTASSSSSSSSSSLSFASSSDQATDDDNVIFHVNLQTSTMRKDVSASNGVLHVLDFEPGERGVGGEGVGAVVPDVLELTYAYGFRSMYEAILGADSEPVGQAQARREAGYRGHAPSDPGDGATVSMSDALMGEDPHTLVAVAESGFNGTGTRTGTSRAESFSEDTLRYQILVGDQDLTFGASSPSMELETLYGQDAHAFNNVETPNNPFVSLAGDGSESGVYVDQSKVIPAERNMVALNGRIHEISEPLNVPAPNIFAVLSSHPELEEWANWVQQTGLAEILSDATAGPFTVLAPINSALMAIPNRSGIEADKRGLADLVRFHCVTGVAYRFDDGRRSRAGDGGGSRVLQARDGDDDLRGATSWLSSGRLFTPSLANASASERAALAAENYCSGRPLQTLLAEKDEYEDQADAPAVSVQIGAGNVRPGQDMDGVCDSGSRPREDEAPGGYCSNAAEREGSFRVFVGPQKRRSGLGLLNPRNWLLGAFSSEVVIPDLNAVNGVVHGISGVMTHPGYNRPSPDEG